MISRPELEAWMDVRRFDDPPSIFLEGTFPVEDEPYVATEHMGDQAREALAELQTRHTIEWRIDVLFAAFAVFLGKLSLTDDIEYEDCTEFDCVVWSHENVAFFGVPS
jgi:hypothetical protein